MKWVHNQLTNSNFQLQISRSDQCIGDLPIGLIARGPASSSIGMDFMLNLCFLVRARDKPCETSITSLCPFIPWCELSQSVGAFCVIETHFYHKLIIKPLHRMLNFRIFRMCLTPGAGQRKVIASPCSREVRGAADASAQKLSIYFLYYKLSKGK